MTREADLKMILWEVVIESCYPVAAGSKPEIPALFLNGQTVKRPKRRKRPRFVGHFLNLYILSALKYVFCHIFGAPSSSVGPGLSKRLKVETHFPPNNQVVKLYLHLLIKISIDRWVLLLKPVQHIGPLWNHWGGPFQFPFAANDHLPANPNLDSGKHWTWNMSLKTLSDYFLEQHDQHYCQGFLIVSRPKIFLMGVSLWKVGICLFDQSPFQAIFLADGIIQT